MTCPLSRGRNFLCVRTLSSRPRVNPYDTAPSDTARASYACLRRRKSPRRGPRDSQTQKPETQSLKRKDQDAKTETSERNDNDKEDTDGA